MMEGQRFRPEQHVLNPFARSQLRNFAQSVNELAPRSDDGSHSIGVRSGLREQIVTVWPSEEGGQSTVFELRTTAAGVSVETGLLNVITVNTLAVTKEKNFSISR